MKREWIKTGILAVVFLAALTVYLAAGGGRSGSRVSVTGLGKVGKPALPRVEPDSVNRLEITPLEKDVKPYVLEKNDDGSWTVISHRNRPADPDFAMNVARALAGGEVFEVRPVEDGDYSAYKFSIRIRAWNKAGNKIADVETGREVAPRAGIFCRFPDDATVYVVGGDDFNFYNLGVEYKRRSKRNLLADYHKKLRDWHSRVRVWLEEQRKTAEAEGKSFQPEPPPAEILAEKPSVGLPEQLVFRTRDLYDRTVLNVKRSWMRRVVIETPTQEITLKRVSPDNAEAVEDWEVVSASGFKHADSIKVNLDLLNNMLKRFEDGRGIQADDYAPDELVDDLNRAGLDTPAWRITIFGAGDEVLELAVGSRTDALSGDVRAVTGSARPGDVFIMGPAIYKSFMYPPADFLKSE